MRRDEITLLDISKACRLVLYFIQGMGKDALFLDLNT